MALMASTIFIIMDDAAFFGMGVRLPLEVVDSTPSFWVSSTWLDLDTDLDLE